MADKRVSILKHANKLFRQGKIDAAIKEYTKVLNIKPDDLEVRRILGDLHLRQNTLPDAIKQFEWIADYYLKEGFFAKAIAMYKRITRIDPNYEKAAFKLAELYTKQGLIIEAKQIYLDLAEEYKRDNNQKKSLDMYKKILEFDRNNIKMRLLLADNYFKEGLEENAVNEYLIASDILLNKKDYQRAEDLLKNTLSKVKDLKIIQKLVACYSAQDKEEKAIALLQGMGMELFKNVELMKYLGELYFKKGQINEAENVFAKIAEINPEESEVIMKLGKVYLQREDYDRTYELFLPVVDKNIENQKFDEAASLLRFIIASNNTYIPALKKLASIFELSGKNSNLIALYESLIPIYERKNDREELIRVLEKLIKLSDSPFTYEEQLSRIMGEQNAEQEEERENEKETEIINSALIAAQEALESSNFDRAIQILLSAKIKFGRDVSIREKLFSTYQAMGNQDAAVDEGKDLLLLYQSLGKDDEYSDLFDKLSAIRPEDDKLMEISGEEKTNIDIDFGKGELAEEIGQVHMDSREGMESDGDVFVLSDAENLTDSREKINGTPPKSLSSLLSELDFYINDGYFGDAEDLIEKLKQKYPGNDGLINRIKKFEQARNKAANELDEPEAEFISPEEAESMRIEEPVAEMDTGGMEIEEAPPEMEVGGMEIEGPPPEMDAGDMPIEPPGEADFIELQPEPPVLEGPEIEEPLMEHEVPMEIGMPEPEMPMPEMEAFNLDMGMPEEESKDDSTSEIPADQVAANTFRLEPSIADENRGVREFEDLEVGMTPPAMQEEEPVQIAGNDFSDLDKMAFEIEMDESPAQAEALPVQEVEREIPVQAPSAGFKEIAGEEPWTSSSVEDEFDLDQILSDDSGPVASGDQESPFQEVEQVGFGFDQEEDLLASEGFMEVEAFLEVEERVPEELEVIAHWIKELEKQRTSTIEKNMMEIFDEFKKGIDEKIGKEDYETRYNLGIAYKEMGLVEEAIHEFLISSKHPERYFDSAGLLGMCFREKGMMTEAISWYERALDAPERTLEEYLAIKYELIITMKLKHDYQAAKQVAEDILNASPDYRDVPQLYAEIEMLSAQA